MKETTRSWRDVAQSYSLAFDSKKMVFAFAGALLTFLWVWASANVYAALGGPYTGMDELCQPRLYRWLTVSGAAEGAYQLLPLLNPFCADLLHAVCSIVFLAGLFAIWAYFGGAITRLAVLEYGKDELPSLGEGVSYARDRFVAFAFTPLAPLIGMIAMALCLIVLGLLGRIPYLGPVCLGLGHVAAPFLGLAIVFIAVYGVVSFGLMFPAVSADGKDAFEGWSRAYGYLIWSPGRFFGYSALALVVGIISCAVVALFGEALICATVTCVNFGLGGAEGWIEYDWGHYYRSLTSFFGGGRPALDVAMDVRVDEGGRAVAANAAVFAFMIVRGLVAGYAIAYYFCANSIIYLLLRRDVDRIDIDAIYDPEGVEELGKETRLPPEREPAVAAKDTDAEAEQAPSPPASEEEETNVEEDKEE